MRQWVHVLLLGVILSAGAWLSLKDLTFFSPDTGLRYLQVRAFEEHGWRQGAVPYAGLQFDPGMRFVPYYNAYSRYGDELLFVVSLYFPLLVALLRTVLGPVGIVVAPVLGTLLASGTVAGLWRLAGQGRRGWVFWGTALATPLVVYSFTLWDHTLGVGLYAAAVYLAARALREERRFWPFFAGLVAAFAIAQRPDAGPMALALGFALLLVGDVRWRRFFLYGAGGVVGMLATMPLNVIWGGHPLGLVVARPFFGYLRGAYHTFLPYDGSEITRAVAATRQLLAVDGGRPMTLVAALVLVTGSFLLALALRQPAWRRRGLLYFCLTLIVVGTIIGLLPARHGAINGMLTTLPLFGLALAYVDKPEQGASVYRLVFITTWLGIMLALLVNRAPGGGQWGGRYLLPAVPLLFFLAIYAADHYRRQMPAVDAQAFTHVVLILVVLSVLVQLVGVRALFLHRTEHKQWQSSIAALPAEVIFTNSPFIASFMAALEGRTFLYVENEADIGLLASRLAIQGVDRFGWVPLPPEAGGVEVPERINGLRLEQVVPFVYEIVLDAKPPMGATARRATGSRQ